jgi:hypothetical protein
MMPDNAESVRTPEFWMKATGIQVCDPDGWDRKAESGPGSWWWPITRAEFIQRAMRSTVRAWPAHIDGSPDA